MISDQVGDLLTRIRNATRAGKVKCSVPASKLKREVLQILLQEGYILGYQTVAQKHSVFTIDLKYKGKISVIQEIKRVSKPGLRIYVKKKKIPLVLRGIGIAILSTSSGVMTGKEAKNKNVGGEILSYVW